MLEMVENCGKWWKIMENGGKLWKIVENLRDHGLTQFVEGILCTVISSSLSQHSEKRG